MSLSNRGRKPAKDRKIHLPKYTVRESIIKRFQSLADEQDQKSPSQHIEDAILDYLRTYSKPLEVKL